MELVMGQTKGKKLDKELARIEIMDYTLKELDDKFDKELRGKYGERYSHCADFIKWGLRLVKLQEYCRMN
jgi:hypothetical protein